MAKKKRKAPPAPKVKAQPASQSVLRPLSQGQKYDSQKLTSFGRALWRGGTRFTRTFLSMAGMLLLNSTRMSLSLARNTPAWVRESWRRRAESLQAPPPPSSSSASSSSSSLNKPPPKDAWEGANGGLMQQQFKAFEELQRTATRLVEQKVRNTNIQFDHHVQRTEGAVSISIRSTSSIRINSGGESGAASPRDGGRLDDGSSARIQSAGESNRRVDERLDDRSSARIKSAYQRGAPRSRDVEKFKKLESASERSAASSREVEKADDSASLMFQSAFEPSFDQPSFEMPPESKFEPSFDEPSFEMPPADDKSNDRPSYPWVGSKRRNRSVIPLDDEKLNDRSEDQVLVPRDDEKLKDRSKDQVLAHMDLVMQRLPIPAMATVMDKRGRDHTRQRRSLRAEVLRQYRAESRWGKVWCCIRREWMEASQVRTAHICPVSVGEAYLQYVFGHDGPHLWNAQNAIPISCELEEALDAGKLVIVPADAETCEADDLFQWDLSDQSIPQAGRFKIVVFDDSVQTKDGKLKAHDLHGRLLGFQDPNFRPGMRYICFNVVMTLARRMRYKVRGTHDDLERLGDSRFLLTPGKYVRDSWLLKMCAQVGLDVSGANDRSNSKPDVALDIEGANDRSNLMPEVTLDINGTNDKSDSKPDVALDTVVETDKSDLNSDVGLDIDGANDRSNSNTDVALDIDGEHDKLDSNTDVALDIDGEHDKLDSKPEVALDIDDEHDKFDSKPDVALDIDGEHDKFDSKPDVALNIDGEHDKFNNFDLYTDAGLDIKDEDEPESKTKHEEPSFLNFFGPHNARTRSYGGRNRLRRKTREPYTDLTPVRDHRLKKLRQRKPRRPRKPYSDPRPARDESGRVHQQMTPQRLTKPYSDLRPARRMKRRRIQKPSIPIRRYLSGGIKKLPNQG